ncbi:hypothetical protein CR203_22610 [Salipaludibacillus neizhouensis]|uniref:YetF C-terminal domain-containing protein n=1 Tax=Salipaludibacillus neizhouensis TaxID=885475 RepID=A0A3A9K5U2_9BACI|nr:YetF domain-containing protein [Salipaludibacillus neizhouensis]RKL65063.1 hypothetical protein CR203_22610 [Salipaludibacillus neizhouensis]
MIENYLSQLPSLPFPLKALLILTSGVILIRLTGKRSITQMTVPEVIFLIALGTILIAPLHFQREYQAVYGGTLLAIGLILINKIQIWFPTTRKYLFGIPSIIIKDGKMMTKEIRRGRLTTDEVEMRLRLSKVGNIKDIVLAVLEPNGQLSITLKSDKVPATKGDIENIQKDLQKVLGLLSSQKINISTENSKSVPPLFSEAYKEAKEKDYKQ